MKSQKAASDASEQSEGTDEKETLTEEGKKGEVMLTYACFQSLIRTYTSSLS